MPCGGCQAAMTVGDGGSWQQLPRSLPQSLCPPLEAPRSLKGGSVSAVFSPHEGSLWVYSFSPSGTDRQSVPDEAHVLENGKSVGAS